MQSLIRDARKKIEDFVNQREDLIMLAKCRKHDMGILLKIIRDVDLASPWNIFLLFADNFTDPAGFVSSLTDNFIKEHETVSRALEKEGKEKLPPVPGHVKDESVPPDKRLKNLMAFVRSFVPSDGGHLVIWGICPLEIENRKEYAKFISSFLPEEKTENRIRGTRIIFRINMEKTENSNPQNVPFMQTASFDFGQAAFRKSMEKDAADENLSEDERMGNLYCLAVLDYAHNRVPAAEAKLKKLLGYYQGKKNPLMEAMVMNAFGDLYFHRIMDIETARHWYECAAVSAVKSKSHVLLTIVVKNLGDLFFAWEKYDKAWEFYDNLDKLATKTADPETKARALELKGLCLEKRKLFEPAAKTLEDAASFCKKAEIDSYLEENLRHLERIYKKLGFNQRLKHIKNELGNMKKTV